MIISQFTIFYLFLKVILALRLFLRYGIIGCKHSAEKGAIRILEGLREETLGKKNRDLEWFVGFSEAEAMFSITSEGNLSFRINLHRDDHITLVYIKSLLSNLANRDIGVIVESKKVYESYYAINKFKDIYEIIIPIFSKYYLTTSKYLDFFDLKKSCKNKSHSLFGK